MKPLNVIVLILCAATLLPAQGTGTITPAEAARQERARQARLKSERIYTDANSHTVESAAPVVAAKANSPAAEAVKPAVPTAVATDPSVNKEMDVQKARARVRDLEDRETELKLQINDSTNQLFAPVTDQASRDQVQSRLAEVIAKLVDAQKDLAQARTNLKEMESQTAPKK